MNESIPNWNESVGAGIEISQIFATPFARLLLPNAASLNPALEKAILSRESSGGAMNRSNIGGWHSRQDFLRWPEVSASGFEKVLKGACLKLIGTQSGVRRFSGQLELSAWANVNRKGSFNRRHNHPASLWSGVYYVSVGDISSTNDPSAGNLILEDPRGSINMVHHPGDVHMGTVLEIKPVNGLLVIFPSWLYHHVTPFESDNTRISIAFNSSFANYRDNS